MRHFHLTRNKYHKPAVNLDKLWSLVSEQTRQYYKDKTDGPVPVIDVVRAVSMLCWITFIWLIPSLLISWWQVLYDCRVKNDLRGAWSKAFKWLLEKGLDISI